MKKNNFKTTYPDQKIEYNEWCKLFKFGSRYQSKEGINNAMRIMSLWDGYHNHKNYFVKVLSNKTNEYDW